MSGVAVRISDVVVGGRVRSDNGDVEELARSIRDVGLMHPIVLDKNNRLVAGLRRMEAAKILGWEEIPCRVISDLDDATKCLLAERDENTCRKDFTPSEAVAMGRLLEEIERPKAKERQVQKAGGKQGEKVCSDKISEQTTGTTREKVGKAIGMSGITYQRAKAVAQAAEEDPEKFGELKDEMDRTGKVLGPFNKMQSIKKDPQTNANKAGASNKQSKAILLAYDAINCLKQIRSTDPDRKLAYKTVADFIKANK